MLNLNNKASLCFRVIYCYKTIKQKLENEYL